MSSPEATPDLLAAITPAEKRPAQWIVTVREAWRMGRTKAGVIIFIAILAIAFLGPLFAPHSPTSFVDKPFAAPSAKAWFGADNIGRDVLSRVLWGGRTVIGLALAATVIGLVLGVGLGMISGYARRWVDEVIMRLLDVVLAFPTIVLALLFVSIVGPRLWLIVLIVGISHAPRIARVTRAATLEISQRDFIKAAEALGVARRKILSFEILPNITSPLLVEFGLRLTYSIGLIAGLSFLGDGMQPPSADWGLMINENALGISIQPYSVFIPVALIAILTIGVNLATDGLSRAMIGIERDTGAS